VRRYGIAEKNVVDFSPVSTLWGRRRLRRWHEALDRIPLSRPDMSDLRAAIARYYGIKSGTGGLRERLERADPPYSARVQTEKVLIRYRPFGIRFSARGCRRRGRALDAAGEKGYVDPRSSFALKGMDMAFSATQ
jgi:hypothetical protein